MDWYTNQKTEKWERELAKLRVKTATVLTSPPDDPIWADQAFWDGRWVAMVDREGELTDKICAERMRLLSEANF